MKPRMRSRGAVALATPVARPASSWGRRAGVDLGVVAEAIHSAEGGRKATLRAHWRGAGELGRMVLAPTSEDLSDFVADKSYHP